MGDKERLERIEDIDQEIGNGFAVEDLDLNTMTVVNREDFEWLNAQAKRVEELERYVEASTHIQRQLRKENKRYKYALEKIYDNWITSTSAISGGVIAFNAKEIAYQALRGCESDE
ncbi:hypothetical protein KQI76_06875 [Amphibacillus sp. MSJ-3]|uniref:hypothetical protein n=1 Tax=Amphibacillus sp. MSJ-3 TaxID=2841505 RepID=UPI001C0EBADE|nr:hypothetical protein [Amphibacillus sp. MSJ-3]MBU5594884.1 hypothetical protein [Amphibacillus sp. MSJ-3]